jgi:hypothetical protein
VVVHARLDGLQQDTDGCEIEGGSVIHPQSPCCATRGCRRWWKTQAAPSSASGEPLEPCPPGCSDRSVTATGSAGSPDAALDGSPRHTTSGGGVTAAGPTWTTWPSSARSTTGLCTSTGGRSSETTRTISCGAVPTGRATNPARHRASSRSRADRFRSTPLTGTIQRAQRAPLSLRVSGRLKRPALKRPAKRSDGCERAS